MVNIPISYLNLLTVRDKFAAVHLSTLFGNLAMLSSKEYLDKKTGPHGIGRFSYLQSLVTEYQDTIHSDYKLQVLANIANFAYDPVNYEYMTKLNVVDLFIDALDEENEDMIEYAVGGLCNICLDKAFKEEIIKKNGVSAVIKCLSRPREDSVLSAMTTLMYLVTPVSKAEITQAAVIHAMLRLSQSANRRFSNLAHVFLDDYCDEQEVETVQNELLLLQS